MCVCMYEYICICVSFSILEFSSFWGTEFLARDVVGSWAEQGEGWSIEALQELDAWR